MIYTTFCLFSLMDGRLGCFQFGVITNNPAAAILVCVFGAHMCAFLLHTDLTVEFLGHRLCIYSTSIDNWHFIFTCKLSQIFLNIAST